MNKIKTAQKAFIIEEATKLFFSHRLKDITMSDIAEFIEIGEATLYRYFGKKSNIVLLAAENLSEKVETQYFKIDDSKNGFERIQDFYNSFLKVFNENKSYFSFINQFDAFVLSEKNMDLSRYGEQLGSYKKIYNEAFELGLRDGSIKFDGDVELFYRSTTLALLNLCKKLATEEQLVEEDKKFDSVKEIEALIEIFLYRIK